MPTLAAPTFRPLPGSAGRADQVAVQIRDLVESNHLKPGDKLPSERDLAARLGVARGSLREALRSLASMGLVESRWGQGVFVRDPDDAQADTLIDGILDPRGQRSVLQELLELRKLIEPQAAAWAAQRATDRQRPLFDVWCLQAAQALAAGPLSAQLAEDLDERLHGLVAQAAHNRPLLRTMSSLLDLLQASRRKARRVPGRVQLSMTEHARVCRAIIDGNAEEARQAMIDHIASVEASTVRPAGLAQAAGEA
ncbi:MAG: FadR/GntR family transcriptional regulator [Chloroflexota bacterium]